MKYHLWRCMNNQFSHFHSFIRDSNWSPMAEGERWSKWVLSRAVRRTKLGRFSARTESESREIRSHGSHWTSIRCIHTLSCQFNAMPNHNGTDNLPAQGAELGSNDHRPTAFGEMASHTEIFRMFLHVDRCGEVDFG